MPHKIQTKNMGICDLRTWMSTIKNSVEILSTELGLHLYKKSEINLVLGHWYPEFHLIVWRGHVSLGVNFKVWCS